MPKIDMLATPVSGAEIVMERRASQARKTWASLNAVLRGLLIGTTLLITVAHAATSEVVRLPDGADSQFIKCGESKAMSSLVTRLMRTGQPLAKVESHFTFSVQGRVLGLPASEFWIGVCDVSGEQACGWGTFRAFVIELPFKEARSSLKRRYRIDFTVEKRDSEVEATERPILTRAKGTGRTMLFCDPGTL